MATTTASLMSSLCLVLGQTEVCEPTGADDVFVIRAERRPADMQTGGARTVWVSGVAGRRYNTGTRCNEWETQITVALVVPAMVGVEDSELTSEQVALTDAETLLESVYSWEAQTAALTYVDPQLAVVQDDANGNLVVSRIIILRYQRT